MGNKSLFFEPVDFFNIFLFWFNFNCMYFSAGRALLQSSLLRNFFSVQGQYFLVNISAVLLSISGASVITRVSHFHNNCSHQLESILAKIRSKIVLIQFGTKECTPKKMIPKNVGKKC